MGNTVQKKSFMDKITDFTMKIAEPLGKLADVPAVAAIQNGLLAAMPLIIIGSVFLILYVLGSPSVGNSGTALIPFLAPIAGKLVWVNGVTLSFLSLYCSISIAESYAEKLNINTKSAGLLGIATFIVFTVGGNDASGGIAVTSFSASGLFVCILTSLLSVKLLSICIKKNITIKMPASVPPNVGNAFTALIPYFLCITVAWIIRQLFDFDMVAWLMGVLTPFISGADNIFVAVISKFVAMLLWSVGLHGDNMWTAMFTPFGTMWLEENTKALASGTSVYNLPHVLAAYGQTGLDRLVTWPAAAWPVIFLMIKSKVKYLKALGIACAPAGIFTIVEPVIFGLPLALNPFLLIPFVLSGTVSFGIGYALMSTSFFGKFFAAPPWATPPFFLGPLGTGDLKTALLPIISFIIGLVIYLPFWKQFEKDCLRKEKEREAKLKVKEN